MRTSSPSPDRSEGLCPTRLGYTTPSKTTEQKWLDDVQKDGQPQIGLGKFLVRLLVDLSHKNNDPHRDSRDTPEAPCRNDWPFERLTIVYLGTWSPDQVTYRYIAGTWPRRERVPQLPTSSSDLKWLSTILTVVYYVYPSGTHTDHRQTDCSRTLQLRHVTWVRSSLHSLRDGDSVPLAW
jgi:hypothetical protein